MTPLPESTELRAVGFLAEEIHRTAMPAPSGAWLRFTRRGLIATLLSVFAAIPATIVIIIGASSPAPTSGVIRQGDGRAPVTLDVVTGISVLNATLPGAGLAVRAVPVLPGCRAPLRRVGRGDAPNASAKTVMLRSEVRPRPVRDRTLVLTPGQNAFTSVRATVLGPPPVCGGIAG